MFLLPPRPPAALDSDSDCLGDPDEQRPELPQLLDDIAPAALGQRPFLDLTPNLVDLALDVRSSSSAATSTTLLPHTAGDPTADSFGGSN